MDVREPFVCKSQNSTMNLNDLDTDRVSISHVIEKGFSKGRRP